MKENIFKNATKNRYRFEYYNSITTEDLWDLTLEQLDIIYQKLKREEYENSEESLLIIPRREEKILSDKIAIVKEIVEDKLAAKLAAEEAIVRRTRNQKIMEIIENKRDPRYLENMSVEDLIKLVGE